MLCHYLKKRLNFSVKLPAAPSYSLLYSCLPGDKLFVRNDIYNYVKEADKDKELTNRRDVDNIFEQLINCGAIKLIHETQLERFLEKL